METCIIHRTYRKEVKRYMNEKLLCPKCGNNSFKLTISKEKNPIKTIISNNYFTYYMCQMWMVNKEI